jgi:hypothetical protein
MRVRGTVQLDLGKAAGDPDLIVNPWDEFLIVAERPFNIGSNSNQITRGALRSPSLFHLGYHRNSGQDFQLVSSRGPACGQRTSGFAEFNDQRRQIFF